MSELAKTLWVVACLLGFYAALIGVVYLVLAVVDRVRRPR